jgi:transketolase
VGIALQGMSQSISEVLGQRLPTQRKGTRRDRTGLYFRWERFVGTPGQMIGVKSLGASELLKELQRKFGSEPDRVVGAAKEQLGRG